jgi:ubiquinone/menaquinone biosynthesis C-methylase UbiE
MTTVRRDPDMWTTQAERWIAWARSPGHDAYWHHRDDFFGSVVPLPRGLTLDLGCGEGRFTRDLAARGHTVIGLDRSEALVTSASAAQPTRFFVVADASSLPFPDESFGTVVAHNALIDIGDLDGCVREVGRVLEPGGAFCILWVPKTRPDR